MTTKEFCALYEMNVNEMCEYLKLSRQELNKIVRGCSRKNSLKKKMALKNLRNLAADLYNKEYSRANKNYFSRLAAAEIFEVKE